MAITPKTYPNILKYGLQASYNSLAAKDANVLYFCTDTKKIYKGTVDFTDSVVYSTKAADVAAPIIGKLYVFSATGTCEVYDGSKWTVVSYPLTTTINASSDDVHVPSAKAVYDFVEAEISTAMTGTDVVKSIVSTTDAEGSITYTTGDGNTHDVALKGVVTTPTYSAATRKFTFPVVGGQPVEVELGKDIFIDPDASNRYENGNIYLYLNDGSGEKAATELVIPVTSLVTDYFGDDTDSVSVNVDNSTHKVTADVILREDEVGVFTNALKLSTVEGKKGLYVDLAGVVGDIAGLEGRIDTAEATLEKLEADVNTVGSVDYKIAQESTTLKTGVIKTAQDTADQAVATAAAAQSKADANETAIGVLNGGADVAGSVAKAVADESKVLKEGVIKTAQDTADQAVADAAAAQATADQNAADIAALAAATTVWGTF